MNSPPYEERRPRAGSGGHSKSLAGDVTILRPAADLWQELAAHVDGAFVVVVKTNHGRYRRRVWLTLAAAERAAEKARDAGHDAEVMLCELKPLHRVEGAPPVRASLAANGGGL